MVNIQISGYSKTPCHYSYNIFQNHQWRLPRSENASLWFFVILHQTLILITYLNAGKAELGFNKKCFMGSPWSTFMIKIMVPYLSTFSFTACIDASRQIKIYASSARYGLPPWVWVHACSWMKQKFVYHIFYRAVSCPHKADALGETFKK